MYVVVLFAIVAAAAVILLLLVSAKLRPVPRRSKAIITATQYSPCQKMYKLQKFSYCYRMV